MMLYMLKLFVYLYTLNRPYRSSCGNHDYRYTRGFGERYGPKAKYETGGLAGWRDGESRLGLLRR